MKRALWLGFALAVAPGCMMTGNDKASSSEAPPLSPEPRAAARLTMNGDGAGPRQNGDKAAHGGPQFAVGIDPGGVGNGTPLTPKTGHELAAFAGGCFWGTEEAFRRVPGVTATAVGFTGGHVDAPTYARVCDHDTGHAETVLVEFDPKQTSYDKLLAAFFDMHNPTTLDRQGPDEGDQYRSEIFTFSDAQASAAKAAIRDVQKQSKRKVVTLVAPVPRFWKAEDYHQQYDEKNGVDSCPAGKMSGSY